MPEAVTEVAPAGRDGNGKIWRPGWDLVTKKLRVVDERREIAVDFEQHKMQGMGVEELEEKYWGSTKQSNALLGRRGISLTMNVMTGFGSLPRIRAR